MPRSRSSTTSVSNAVLKATPLDSPNWWGHYGNIEAGPGNVPGSFTKDDMGTSNRDMVDGAARTQLNADLAALHCRVHDPGDPPLFTREPQSSMQPCHWRWRDLWPLLQRLGQELAIGSGGQRRTLRLAPPGLPYGTTPTFWGSI